MGTDSLILFRIKGFSVHFGIERFTGMGRH